MHVFTPESKVALPSVRFAPARAPVAPMGVGVVPLYVPLVSWSESSWLQGEAQSCARARRRVSAPHIRDSAAIGPLFAGKLPSGSAASLGDQQSRREIASYRARSLSERVVGSPSCAKLAWGWRSALCREWHVQQRRAQDTVLIISRITCFGRRT